MIPVESSDRLRLRSFEQFEDRLAMSSLPLTEAVVGPAIAPALLPQSDQIQFSYNQEALQQIRANYGLDGKGQTIAVIDSGIAWDHYALGGGFGTGHRVVGGWDFAENDAQPYDDGSAGFHGTHVAGIIGSSNATYRGVASGADLVGLRVFDDQGTGRMEWVEQALRWVHDHRDQFANPITTVNLSLGADWNSSSLPSWSTLEDEFAQLKDDGIFISVAAGNAFQKYQTTGLAYPAVSSHVVPVASHGPSGTLSSFSQRDARVLVAPGESIRSTAPDHLFTGGKTGQFIGASGTSMATPYVAGASAVLREALQFMGATNVNQQTLYEHLIASADKIFDPLTNGWYHRVNLERALSQAIGDTEGDQWESATQLGQLVPGQILTGTIGRIQDADAFLFTANQTGTVRLNFSATHDLQPVVHALGGNGHWDGSQLVLHVTAGQQSGFRIETQQGIGHYRIESEFEPALSALPLGTVFHNTFQNLTVSGEQLFQLTAGRSGILTLLGTARSGQAQFSLLDSQGQELTRSQFDQGQMRIDAQVAAGDVLYVRCLGQARFDLLAANLVSLRDGTLEVNGTHGQDFLQFNAGSRFEIQINTLNYSFARDSISEIQIYGHHGPDVLTAQLGAGNEQAHLGRGAAAIQSSTGWTLEANGLHSITLFAGGGQDRIHLADSAGADRLFNDRAMVAMMGAGYANYSVGFEQVLATAAQGWDRVELNGTAGDDFVSGDGQSLELRNTMHQIQVQGFDSIRVQGGGGRDLAALKDSIANDSFTFAPRSLQARIHQTEINLTEFSTVSAVASHGYDQVRFMDSAGYDLFFQNPESTGMSGSNYLHRATGFDLYEARSSGGGDTAQLSDSASDDQVWLHQRRTVVSSPAARTVVDGFARVNLIANRGGIDTVNLIGTSGSDWIYHDASGTSMQTAQGALNRVVGAERVHVDGWQGADFANLVGSQQVEILTATAGQIRLQQDLHQLNVRNVRHTLFDGGGGPDEVVFAQLDENDNLVGSASRATLQVDSQTIEAVNFGVLAAKTADGHASQYELASVDYLFMLEGNWKKKANP